MVPISRLGIFARRGVAMSGIVAVVALSGCQATDAQGIAGRRRATLSRDTALSLLKQDAKFHSRQVIMQFRVYVPPVMLTESIEQRAAEVLARAQSWSDLVFATDFAFFTALERGGLIRKDPEETRLEEQLDAAGNKISPATVLIQFNPVTQEGVAPREGHEASFSVSREVPAAVTGIRQEGNRAFVEATLKQELTKVGRVILDSLDKTLSLDARLRDPNFLRSVGACGDAMRAMRDFDTVRQETFLFEFYDDGWRLRQ